MIDFNQIQSQMAAFGLYQSEVQVRKNEQCRAAIGILSEPAFMHPPEVLPESRKKELIARPLTVLSEAVPPPLRPEVVTVAATDGSQVFPDHHIEPACYLLQVSHIAFQYGTHERALMRAHAELRYRDQDAAEFGYMEDSIKADWVSAVRDVRELTALFQLALGVQVADRPILALSDGTLIRWMLSELKNEALQKAVLDRYRAVLTQFREAAIPVASYISQPNTTEVRNLLARLGRVSLDALTDRHVFSQVLQPGERSALYASASHVLKTYGPEQQIVFFYVHVKGRGGISEVARVELPFWVMQHPQWLDLIHAVVLDQAEKGNGYPIALAEAHEKAVIRQHEKDFFFRMLDKQLLEVGLGHLVTSRKQIAKNRPVV
ncbi:MAG TPA: DNA double-strand break repair nuclease NurA [Rhodothermales bacterium]|nr:DNA double-strand break repair nuclease NurA [Rhodothermales bacterium]